MADYQSTLAAQAGKTVQTTDGYTVTYDANGYALQSVSPDGQVKYYDSLGNETSSPRQDVPTPATQTVAPADANYASGETAENSVNNSGFSQPPNTSGTNNNIVSNDITLAQEESQGEPLSEEEQNNLSGTTSDSFDGTVTWNPMGSDEEYEETDSWEDQDGLMVLGEDQSGETENDDELIELSGGDELLDTTDSADTTGSGGMSNESPGSVINTNSSGSTATTNTPVAPSPVANPLNSFPSYTYGLSLFLLHPTKEFNEIIKNPAGVASFNNCLIASAGRFNSSAGTHKRNPAFKDDFYFDSFKITTVVGLNQKTRASNAIDFNFTIIEPYGLTLLNRIIDAAKIVDAKNYLQMPYLLQLDFFGYDDNGLPLPESTTSKFRKRFPIKIIEMKTRVGNKGSEYAFRAVPFNHQAFQETAAATPISMTVTAGTVDKFFGTAETDELFAKQQAEKEAARDTIQAAQIGYDDSGDYVYTRDARGASDTVAAQTIASPYNVVSYATAFNLYYEDLKNNKNRRTIDVIKFVIDPEILKKGGGIITRPTKDNKMGTKALMAVGKKSAEAAQKGVGPDPKYAGFSISAGTSVLSVIDQIMRCTNYYLDQFLDPNDPHDKEKFLTPRDPNKPLNYFKVIPQVKLDAFDEATGMWSKTTTYYIQKHLVYDSKSIYGPEAKPNGAVKEYNYIYTGKNTDIIDFQIDFNTAYYTSVTVDAARFKNSIGGASQTPDTEIDAGASRKAQVGGIQPKTQVMQATNVETNVGVDSINDPKAQIGADAQKNIYSSSRGDMINLKLKIIGDPHFIKQDDVWTNPSQSSYSQQVSGQIIQENQSIVFDRGEIFARVNFKTPVDIDETTGLIRKDTKYSESLFSGYYRVLTVDSEFRSGKFEQTLDLVRAFNQDGVIGGNAGQGGNTGAVARSNGQQTIGDQAGDYPINPGDDAPIGDQEGDYEQYAGQESDTADQEGDYEQYPGQESGGEMYGWESQDTEFGAERNSNLISNEVPGSQTGEDMSYPDGTETNYSEISDSDQEEYSKLSTIADSNEFVEVEF